MPPRRVAIFASEAAGEGLVASAQLVDGQWCAECHMDGCSWERALSEAGGQFSAVKIITYVTLSHLEQEHDGPTAPVRRE
jgi:hypothetical protein